MVFEKIKSGFADAVSSMDNTLKDSLSFMEDLKEAGAEKMNELVDRIQHLAPLIDVTGFNMHEIDVGIGIPPEINIAFLKVKDVDTETIDKLLKENEDKPLFTLIVQTLQKTDALVKDMKLVNYKLGQLSMKIGLPPDVGIKLLRTGNDNPA
jgi:hypothetical protein